MPASIRPPGLLKLIIWLGRAQSAARPGPLAGAGTDRRAGPSKLCDAHEAMARPNGCYPRPAWSS